MFFLKGGVESDNAIECLHRKHERLQFDAVDQLVPGESAIASKDGRKLFLKANTLGDLSLLLQKAKYIADARATNGIRRISVSSQVTCTEENRTIPLGTHISEILVSKETPLELTISGRGTASTSRRGLKIGALMLPDVKVTATQRIGLFKYKPRMTI